MTTTPARNRLDSIPTHLIEQMLRDTEAAVGPDSDGARVLRRALDRCRVDEARRLAARSLSASQHSTGGAAR